MRIQRTEDDHISFIIIDGYNLIGTCHSNLAEQRQDLIRLLSEYKKVKGHDITLVFDGWKSGSNKEESRTIGGVRVVYSRLGEKADLVVKGIISQERKEWIVVSSDREIAAYAWACGSVPVSSERFQSILENSGSFLQGDYDPLCEEEGPAQRKGSSRMASKREKALSRALKKL